jgi:DNA-binding response OmpR family regulator
MNADRMKTAAGAEGAERGCYNLQATLAGLLNWNVKRRHSEAKCRGNTAHFLGFGRLLLKDSGAVRGRPVATTATGFRRLDYLACHVGRVFTRDQLLGAVWSDTAYVTPRSVDVYVRRIREKIEPDAEDPRYLRTVGGTGYRFESPK